MFSYQISYNIYTPPFHRPYDGVCVAKKLFIPDADAAFCSCCCGRLLFSPILRILLRVVGHAGSDFHPVELNNKL